MSNQTKSENLIIFDVGGVMCTGTAVAQKIADFLEIPKERFLSLSHQAGDNELQKGLIVLHEYIDRLSKSAKKRIPNDIWTRFFKTDRIQESYHLAGKMKKKYRIVAGTNTIQPHYDMHIQQGDYAIFDAVYASHQIHHSKPDSSFFSHILEKEGYSTKEAVFVDDTSANVSAAKALGIHAILFEGAKALERELRIAGIL
jgi:putative hydrolase of the HAD superfamily